METCVYGHIFRENVMVRNRASVAMKIQADPMAGPRVPPGPPGNPPFLMGYTTHLYGDEWDGL